MTKALSRLSKFDGLECNGFVGSRVVMSNGGSVQAFRAVDELIRMVSGGALTQDVGDDTEPEETAAQRLDHSLVLSFVAGTRSEDDVDVRGGEFAAAVPANRVRTWFGHCDTRGKTGWR